MMKNNLNNSLNQVENLFIDFDSTVANTIETICKLYNDDYMYYKDFTPAKWWEVESWDFKELTLATREDINKYFNQPRFFRQVDFMPWAKIVIEELKERYNITIVSMGNYPNLCLKDKYVRQTLECDFIGVCFDDYNDKSHINMEGAIFIDDSSSMLKTSNAKEKICFGDEYEWNKDWKGVRLANWMDVRRYLLNK